MNANQSIAIIIVSAVITILLLHVGFLSNVNLYLTDNLYGGQAPLDSIVIVAIDDTSLQEIGRWPWEREVFVETILNLSEAKVIGIDVAFFEPSDSENDLALGQAAKQANVIFPVEFTSFITVDGRVYGSQTLLPIPEISSSKKGYINIITDDDGISRAINTNVGTLEGEEYKSFVAVLYKEFWGKDAPKKNRYLINFAGPPETFKQYSLSDVYSGKVSKDEFKNKLVLIGATSPDMHDDAFVPTSEGKAMPGVEIHANTLQTMILSNSPNEAPLWLISIVIIISSSIVTFLINHFGIKLSFLAAVVLAIAYIFISIILFEQGIIMNLIFVPLGIALNYSFVVAYKYKIEETEKKKVSSAFSKYVAPSVIDEIMKDPEKLKLGGTKREITVFFSDIRGFTSLSEKLSPEKLVSLLNEYLSEMTKIIMESDGVVDKYIGDAIMAFWGAPLKQPDHAVLAVNAALKMAENLESLNKEFHKKGYPKIKIGIGVNTGEAVIGNMGSYERFDYTAMGDTINLGSRLESLTKEYGVQIIISDSTKKKIGKGFVTRKLDKVKVKGKNKPVEIYELVCESSKLDSKTKTEIEEFEKGLDFYFKKKWSDAIIHFKTCEGKATEEFIERCKIFKKNPPEKEWDGSWTMTRK